MSVDQRPAWDPAPEIAEKSRTRTIQCHVCGAEHHPEVGRVFGDNDDELRWGCRQCSTLRERTPHHRVGPGNGKKRGLDGV